MTSTDIGIICVAGLTICLALPATAGAQGIDTASADLPPDGVYETAAWVEATYTGPDLEIILSNIAFIPDVSAVLREPMGNDEKETFIADLTATASVDPDGSGPLLPTTGLAVLLSGPTETIVSERLLSTAGSFQAEIVSMDLIGNVGGLSVELRESAQMVSVGRTDVYDLGGGLYHIDSFFDVFTELSVDGGNSWIASSSPCRIDLVPEPASLVLLALGAAAVIRRRR